MQPNSSCLVCRCLGFRGFLLLRLVENQCHMPKNLQGFRPTTRAHQQSLQLARVAACDGVLSMGGQPAWRSRATMSADDPSKLSAADPSWKNLHRHHCRT